jgi:GT2 family glycosyltransferase
MIDFRRSDAPDASVVVLVTREPALVRPSLDAVRAALPDDVATEVVLVLNTAREATRALLRDGVRGARVVVSPANCGTAAGWNVGFAAARAPQLALIHEDTQPCAGWLEGLLDASAGDPRAAVVSSRILHPDGSVWNGGWVVWRDGWSTTLDERSAPQLMAAGEPYAVDSISSASMLVRRDAFEAIGGFDERTFPTVTTNMDFALAVWRAGHRVLSTPHSVVHHATSAMVHSERGLYSSRLFREFLIRRATLRLREKWGDVLDAEHEPRGDGDPTGDADLHVGALARTAARARRPAPVSPPPSRQLRALTAPDGGWPTAFDDGAAERLRDAQREVDAEFDAWVIADREALRARILELDAGHADAARAHDNALAIARRLEARIAELEANHAEGTRAHENALAIIARLEEEVAGPRGQER